MSKTMQEKLTAGRQYRSVSEMSPTGVDGEYVVEGYATTFEQPYTLYKSDGLQIDEQIGRSAFDACDMADVIMQYDHRGRVYARTSNKTLTLSADEHGLKIRADLGGTEAGRQLYEEIRGGYTCKMSFGFTVADAEEQRTSDKSGNVTYLRTITEINKLYDVSAVSLPANDATEISARGFVDGVIAKVQAERLEREERAARIESLKKMNQKEDK